MPGIKTSFQATGVSNTFIATRDSVCNYWADFTAGTGVGTVQLQVLHLDSGDWMPADETMTATMSVSKVAENTSSEQRHYRWNCSVYSSGTIHCYMQ